MRKRTLTPFGLAVKMRLLERGLTQQWLIEQLREKTGMYVDSSNLYKLMSGQLRSSRLYEAIAEILDLNSKETPL